LRSELKDRDIITHRTFINRGNTFEINRARWQGKTYRIKIDRKDGTVTWVGQTDGLFSILKP